MHPIEPKAEDAAPSQRLRFEAYARDETGRLHAFFRRSLGDEHLARDLVQETLLDAWRARSTYDPSYSFEGWVFRIGQNRMRNLLRRRRLERRWMQPLDAVPEPPGQAGLGGAGLSPAESDAVERLERALRGIPVRQRIALVLRYQEGKSCAEIGEVLDMTPNAVSIQLYHARRTLRGLLAAEAPRSAP